MAFLAHAVCPAVTQSSRFPTMEIRELAEHILFGTTLEEKLVGSGRLVDTSPGKALTTPDTPGRPAELALDRWSESQRVPFGDVRALERDEDRGLVLHFFANHELLAAELMALVLLLVGGGRASGTSGGLLVWQCHVFAPRPMQGSILCMGRTGKIP